MSTVIERLKTMQESLYSRNMWHIEDLARIEEDYPESDRTCETCLYWNSARMFTAEKLERSGVEEVAQCLNAEDGAPNAEIDPSGYVFTIHSGSCSNWELHPEEAKAVLEGEKEEKLGYEQ